MLPLILSQCRLISEKKHLKIGSALHFFQSRSHQEKTLSKILISAEVSSHQNFGPFIPCQRQFCIFKPLPIQQIIPLRLNSNKDNVLTLQLIHGHRPQQNLPSHNFPGLKRRLPGPHIICYDVIDEFDILATALATARRMRRGR